MNTERLRLSPRNRMILLGILIALFLLIFLYDFVSGMILMKRCTMQTTGEITKITTHSSKYSHSTYADVKCVINGNIVMFTSRCTYKNYKGDKIPVHYNPDNPKEKYAFDVPYGISSLKLRFLILIFVIPVWIFMAKRQNQKEIDP